MDLIIGEHGETILYGVIGLMMVFLVCAVCLNKWGDYIPDFKNTPSNNSRDFVDRSKEKLPEIIVDEVIYAKYKDTKFNCRDYIEAKDENGKDISENIRIYGKVNVLEKGVYKLRCVAVSESQLACTKYINVIVE